MSKGKVQSILIGVTLSLCSILLFFTVAEVAVRILYPEIIPSTAYDWSSRHKGYSLEKPLKTFRIVVLGDSFTFGQGVKRDETFPKRLEYLLNKASTGTKFEVINLGFCGLNTVGEFEMLAERGINPETWQPDERYRGLGYKPDLVLLEYTLNDSATSWRSVEQIKQFDDKWRTGEIITRINTGAYSLPIPKFIDKFLTKDSRFYLFFLNRYNQFLARLGVREAGKSAVEATLARYKEDFTGWGYAKQALAEMASVARQNGLPIVIAVYPEIVNFNDYPFKEVHSKVLGIAGSLGFHTLDLFPPFEGLDAKSLMATPYDGHPNAKAHAIAAKTIFEYLIKEGLVPYHKGG